MRIKRHLKALMYGHRLTHGTSIQPDSGRPTCLNRLQNMKHIGFSPRNIIDCGASVGHWSRDVSQLFPGAQIVAIEPNPLVTPKTRETLSSISPRPILEECAVGAEEGIAHLNIWDNEETKMSGSSIKQHVQGEPAKKVEVRMKTLDAICAAHDMRPDLVKLDLQGYELEALRGAESALETTEVFVIEFGCLEAYIDRTTPNELIKFMCQYQYHLYDIVDLIYRPYDNALAGGDFVFARADSKLREHKGYR